MQGYSHVPHQCRRFEEAEGGIQRRVLQEDDGLQERDRDEAAAHQVPSAAIRLLLPNDVHVSKGHCFLYVQGLHSQWHCNPGLPDLQVQLSDR
jgi:hypothetical protein